ncbi:restriction endonuclease subunit S [Roseicella aquatilis]|uniref:restriction endonuclease subunit S n=1 Tax=Roseicella aquatilis TaxID=2527868 RepID=UPI0014042FD0|nr:restriction endonuclease subunit S [Roseicella aquatilis]
MPSHWDVRRNGRLFAQRVETGREELPILEVSLRTGVRVRSFGEGDRKQVMADRSKYKRAAAGDVAYNMMRLWQGAVGVAPEDGLVSPAYVVAAPYDGVDPRYFTYLFRTADYMREVESFSRGIVADRNRLYWGQFKQMPSPYPPLEEQRRIADYLDAHGRLTNRLIRNRRRMLAVLKERRQGIVQDAVARGLQPSEPMQRTGLPWLAEVPTRWNRTHVGSHVRVVNGFPFDSTLFRVGEGLPLVRIRDIFRMQTVVSFAGDPVPEAAIDTGDVLVGMDGDFNVAVWQGGPAMLNQRVCCLRPDARFDRAYLALVMALALKWVNEQTFSTTVKHLSSTTIRRLRFPAPAVEEQEAIVAAVERATSAIAATEKRLRREIGLVEEYRERLIADSVTGALDVRTADIAAPLAYGAEDDLALDDEPDGAEDDVGEDLDAALAEAEE